MSTTEKVLPVRTVGVEIECFWEDRGVASQIVFATAQKHAARIDGDGSIEPHESSQCGREIKTAPLSGTAFHESVLGITDALAHVEAQTNRSCGLHVHVDANELDVRKAIMPHSESAAACGLLYSTSSTQTAQEGYILLYVSRQFLASKGVDAGDTLNTVSLFSILAKAANNYNGIGIFAGDKGQGYYLRDDDTLRDLGAGVSGDAAVFFVHREKLLGVSRKMHDLLNLLTAADIVVRSLIPASRRLNSYCNAIAKAVPSGGGTPRSYSEVMSSVGTRYLGFNLLALQVHGTIECRYHGGTIDGDKIRHWALFIERLITLALSSGSEQAATTLNAFVQTKDRFEALLSMLGLPQDTESYLRERYNRHSRASARLLKTTVTHNKARLPAAASFTRSLATAS